MLAVKTNVTNDRLTRRERIFYRVLHGLGLAWAGCGLLWYVIFDISTPNYWTVALFALGCSLVPIFGYALRSDTRIIHASAWLQSADDGGAATVKKEGASEV